MSTRPLRWTVPVDDNYHPIGTGKVLMVACREGMSRVEVWTEETLIDGTVYPPAVRPAIVVGTGHQIPDATEHLGSAIPAGSRLVWHLYGALSVD